MSDWQQRIGSQWQKLAVETCKFVAILYVFREKTCKIETSCIWIMQILWHLCNLARETRCRLQNVWLLIENWQSLTKISSRDLQICCNLYVFGEKTYEIEIYCMWTMQILWHNYNLARETCSKLQNVWLAIENCQSGTKICSRDLQICCNFICFWRKNVQNWDFCTWDMQIFDIFTI